MRRALLGVGIALAVIVIGALFVDEGEVITLVTHDAEKNALETSLWIVDLPEGTFLRGSVEAGWVQRIGSGAEVEIHRGDDELTYRATPLRDAAILEAVNRAMAVKYGSADQVVNWFVDTTKSTTIVLESLDPAP